MPSSPQISTRMRAIVSVFSRLSTTQGPASRKSGWPRPMRISPLPEGSGRVTVREAAGAVTGRSRGRSWGRLGGRRHDAQRARTDEDIDRRLAAHVSVDLHGKRLLRLDAER